MMMKRRIEGRRRIGAAALVGALVLTVACSDDEEEDTPGSGPTPSTESTSVGTPATVSPTEVAPTTAPPTTTPPTTAPPTTAPPTTAPAESLFQVPTQRLDAIGAAGLTFVPVQYPNQPDDVPWPTRRWTRGTLERPLRGDVDRIVGRAFTKPQVEGDTIDAVVAVQGGELVVEEYNGWDPDEPHVSWSMAKSITQSMVGRLVQEGRIDIWEPYAAPEWADPADPRHEITLDMLLRMSSGLEWTEDYGDGKGDVLRMLFGDRKKDRAHFVADRPPAAKPDTVWSYSTGTSNVVARAVADEVGLGRQMTRWADRELFGKLGISGVRHSLDGTGLVNGGSVIDMKPTDFARFGLLYLRDGVWDGERLLPEGWVDYSRMPTPTANGVYGAHWWIDDADGSGDLGVVAFSAQGFNGQTITIVPELDLVLVVLSAAPGGSDNQVRSQLVEAFAAAR